ncbi:MAG: hypothetical protein IKE24_00210, partial [Clostridia bacterium]|nr:hypothetical protein [Clostridia bacterium]
ILGHISTEVVAANSLASTLRNLVIVGCGGFGTAGSILIGKLLGKSDYDNARWAGKRVFAGSLLSGAVSGCILFLLYFSVPHARSVGRKRRRAVSGHAVDPEPVRRQGSAMQLVGQVLLVLFIFLVRYLLHRALRSSRETGICRLPGFFALDPVRGFD